MVRLAGGVAASALSMSASMPASTLARWASASICKSLVSAATGVGSAGGRA